MLIVMKICRETKDIFERSASFRNAKPAIGHLEKPFQMFSNLYLFYEKHQLRPCRPSNTIV